MRNLIKSSIIIIGILSSVLFIRTPYVHAGLLSGYSGWTEMSDCPACDSIVNFSVYQASDSNWTDDSFFSSVSSVITQYGTLDTSAQYIYMYQIINKDPVTSAEENVYKLAVKTIDNIVTSGGYFANTVFYDGLGNINGSNWSLSNPDPSSFPGDDPIDSITGIGNGQPSTIVSTTNISLAVDNATSQSPFSLQYASGGCPGPTSPCNVLVWNFPYPQDIKHNPDGYSTVVFLTSNAAPAYNFAEVESIQGTGADGEVPTVTPEPVSSILFLAGGATLAGRRYLKRRKQI
ncbi:MAG: hypothetical protein HY756_10670 [Nitrospirae bacterium]|nr:hypothetical protein [Nitrospirota bacterium]